MQEFNQRSLNDILPPQKDPVDTDEGKKSSSFMPRAEDPGNILKLSKVTLNFFHDFSVTA